MRKQQVMKQLEQQEIDRLNELKSMSLDGKGDAPIVIKNSAIVKT